MFFFPPSVSFTSTNEGEGGFSTKTQIKRMQTNKQMKRMHTQHKQTNRAEAELGFYSLIITIVLLADSGFFCVLDPIVVSSTTKRYGFAKINRRKAHECLQFSFCPHGLSAHDMYCLFVCF